MKSKNKFISWLFSTWIGELYFNFLVWKDRKNRTKYLGPKEVHQIIRQYQQCAEGVTAIKDKVNQLVASKTKEEYNKILSNINDLVPLADRQIDPAKQKLMDMLQRNFKRNVDVVTDTDKAKMVDKRINDMYELHSHIEKRNLLRKIRKLRSEGNRTEAELLEKQWLDKYGRSSSKFK